MTEPSPFYRQHVALDAPVVDATANRPWWSVRNHIGQLLAEKAITKAQAHAFAIFQILVEIAHPGSFRTQSFERRDTAGDPTIIMARRIEAASKLVTVREHIGADSYKVLLAHALSNAKWRVLAQAFGVHPRTLRRQTIKALQRLAAR